MCFDYISFLVHFFLPSCERLFFFLVCCQPMNLSSNSVTESKYLRYADTVIYQFKSLNRLFPLDCSPLGQLFSSSAALLIFVLFPSCHPENSLLHLLYWILSFLGIMSSFVVYAFMLLKYILVVSFFAEDQQEKSSWRHLKMSLSYS